jgi:uncharacterized protein YjiK
MMRRPRSAHVLPAVLLLAAAAAAVARDGVALDAFDFRTGAASQVRLPRALREISGLAVSADGRVFAHADERGVVYQLDASRGTVLKSFSLGSPAVRGDFEGIAIAGARFFLVTSTGRLYETREGDDGAAVSYTAYDTGLGATCELEGLAYEPSDRALIIGCKRAHDPALRAGVALFRWSVDRRALSAPARISIPLADVLRGTGDKEFRVSSVEREPHTGHYVIVAGPQRALVEVTSTGAVVAVRSLSRRVHSQPEGLTFLGDSVVLIADEGGDSHGTLTRYSRVR